MKKDFIDPSIALVYAEGKEKDRLVERPLEKERTMRILQAHLPPPPAIILDMGGAAGVYAFPLAKLGYEVHLVDPMALHIKQARTYAKQSGVHLASISQGEARSIEKADSSVDIVLFFGPLYHLFDVKDRIKALSEAYRVLKPGGILLAAAISKFASLMDAAHKGKIYEKHAVIEKELAMGVHHKLSQGVDYLYLHRPSELRQEVESCGFENVILKAIEGPVWEKHVLELLQQDSRSWDKYLELLEKIEGEEAILGASAHMMAIGYVGTKA